MHREVSSSCGSVLGNCMIWESPISTMCAKEKEGIKLKSKKDILTFLAKTISTLSIYNFSFSHRWLGLGNNYEVLDIPVRITLKGKVTSSSSSRYIEGSSERKIQQ